MECDEDSLSVAVSSKVKKCLRADNIRARLLLEVLRLLRTNSSHSTLNKNVQSFKIRLENRGYTYIEILRNVSPESFSEGEKVSLKRIDVHKRKFILFFVTVSSSFAIFNFFCYYFTKYFAVFQYDNSSTVVG